MTSQVLEPLRIVSADEPSTALPALHQLMNHEAAGRAVELVLAREVTLLRDGRWNGRMLQAESYPLTILLTTPLPLTLTVTLNLIPGPIPIPNPITSPQPVTLT